MYLFYHEKNHDLKNEIGYWRKHHRLNDAINEMWNMKHKICDRTPNDEVYDKIYLDEKMLRKLIKDNKKKRFNDRGDKEFDEETHRMLSLALGHAIIKRKIQYIADF